MSYRSRPDFSSEDKKEQPYLFSNGGVIRRKLTSKAGIFSSLFILIALIGVVAGVLLVQQNQDIRRLAGGGTNPEKPNIVFNATLLIISIVSERWPKTKVTLPAPIST